MLEGAIKGISRFQSDFFFRIIQRLGKMSKQKDLCKLDLFASCKFLVHSVQPKPLFWFRSDTETQIGQYFRGIFFIIKGPLIPNLLPHTKDF